jgi:hypothetical protein
MTVMIKQQEQIKSKLLHIGYRWFKFISYYILLNKLTNYEFLDTNKIFFIYLNSVNKKCF